MIEYEPVIFMTAIKLNSISKTFFEDKPVLNQVELSIDSGELVVFIGSSGCGKSTLLRIIAGLDSASSGDVWFDSDLMNDIPPAKRQIGMVFQSYALYPHMTVRENLSFGLKQKKIEKKEINQRVEKISQVLEIEALLEMRPAALSGGQQQRVAIGRCLIQSPRLFLLDEPLSNLDAELRVKTRQEIRRLHKKFKTTMIYVTHDQVEAMTLADKIAVFAPLNTKNKRNLQQFGTPLQLYNQPENKFVAGFLGSPKMNFIPAKIDRINEDRIDIQLNSGKKLSFNNQFKYELKLEAGQLVDLAIRPEQLHLQPNGAEILEVDFDTYEQLGSESILYFLYDKHPIVVKLPYQEEFNNMQNTRRLYFEHSKCFLFDNKTGIRLV
ncbi:ATP-binding cassette domain-containing protein [Catenovulum sp. 2E275]|uniref:ABC transporter ATP-binding protein n=1 Tax=Catenovulum sp. 2E275 TaxID=2980497 RepID=UPI0021D0437C|nr:ATP-binding cassette domain-containing protein [Catenovulum sp. 2E275]MCU4677012.1 ATP-binding cassette domain-containing protein [Catenovulum sp. 2E275]